MLKKYILTIAGLLLCAGVAFAAPNPAAPYWSVSTSTATAKATAKLAGTFEVYNTTRSVTPEFTIIGSSIVNVGTVDGVDVSALASSSTFVWSDYVSKTATGTQTMASGLQLPSVNATTQITSQNGIFTSNLTVAQLNPVLTLDRTGFVGSSYTYLGVQSDQVVIRTLETIPIVFFTSDTERGRFNAAGDMCIGATSGPGLLNVNGDIYSTLGIFASSMTAYVGSFDTVNAPILNSTTAIISTSLTTPLIYTETITDNGIGYLNIPTDLLIGGPAIPAYPLDVYGLIRSTEGFVCPDGTIMTSTSAFAPSVGGGYVPYTGATKHTDLGIWGITASSGSFNYLTTPLVYTSTITDNGTGHVTIIPSVLIGADAAPSYPLDVYGLIRSTVGFVCPDGTIMVSTSAFAPSAGGGYVMKIGDTMTGSLIISGAGITASTGNIAGVFVSTLTFSDGSFMVRAGGEVMSTEITQPGHSFGKGDVLRYSTSTAEYVLAQADTDINAEAIGIVVSTTTDKFILSCGGLLPPDVLTGLTSGQPYFLSDSVAGGLTLSAPTITGSISKPLLIAVASNQGYFFNWRGVAVSTNAFVNLVPYTGATGFVNLDTWGIKTSSVTFADGTVLISTAGLGGGSGSATAVTITQPAHGFTLGDVLRFDSGSSLYVKAQADTGINADVVGIVSTTTLNTFRLSMIGDITDLSGLTPGYVYFLSTATAGQLTTNTPTVVGQVSKPLLIAVSATEGYFYNWRGIAVSTASSGGGSGLSLTKTINQPSHGFTAGDVLRFDAGSSLYTKAQADSEDNADVVGIVSTSTLNTFDLTLSGDVTTLSGLTPGYVYFLSTATAGQLTLNTPTEAGQVSKPLLVAVSATEGYFYNWRGLAISTGACVDYVPYIGSINHLNMGSYGITASSFTTPGIMIRTDGAVQTIGGNARGTGAIDLQISRSIAQQVAAGNYSVISGGQNNRIGYAYDVIGGGIANDVESGYSSVLGGQDNRCFGGAPAAYDGWNSITGGLSNRLLGNSQYAVVVGGNSNSTSASYTFIGGGTSNTISSLGSYSSILGGSSHNITGQSSVICGGGSNTISSDQAFIGGGNSNIASSAYSSVLGGNSNTSSGQYSSTLGGAGNTASGTFSLAAGRRAKATVQGAFTFADSTNADFTNAVQDRFATRFANGYTITGGTMTVSTLAPTNFIISAGASAGLVLTSDANGLAYWATSSSSSISEILASTNTWTSPNTWTSSGTFNAGIYVSTITFSDGTIMTSTSTFGGGSGTSLLSSTNTWTAPNLWLSSGTFNAGLYASTGTFDTIYVSSIIGKSPINVLNDINLTSGNAYLISNSTLAYKVGNNFLIADSGNRLISGSSNLGVGKDSLHSLTSGNTNTAVGLQALWTLTDGQYNTAIGQNAMYSSHPSASLNTAVGYSALEDGSVGSNNSAIGQASGHSNNGNVGDNNVFLGRGAGITYPVFGTKINNSVVIGALATVSSSDTVVLGNTSQNVAIGFSSAAYKLDVNGYIRSVSGYVCPDGTIMTSTSTFSGVYVPYTGAIGNVDLGSYKLVASTLSTSGINILNDGAIQTIPGDARGSGAVDLQSYRTGGSWNTYVASGTNSVISGGGNNKATAMYATVSGGGANTASGQYSLVAGGSLNTCSGNYSAIIGGSQGTVSSGSSIMLGGYNNTVSGNWSTMLNGFNSTISGTDGLSFGYGTAITGNYAVAIGRKAKSQANGAFTFSDSTDADFINNSTNTFAGRFSGGYLFTGGTTTVSGLRFSDNTVIVSTSAFDYNAQLDAIRVSTGVIQGEVDALEISTGVLQGYIDGLWVSTGTLQSDIEALELSTGTLVKKAGDTMTGSLIISGAGIQASTGTFNSIYTSTITTMSGSNGVFYISPSSYTKFGNSNEYDTYYHLPFHPEEGNGILAVSSNSYDMPFVFIENGDANTALFANRGERTTYGYEGANGVPLAVGRLVTSGYNDDNQGVLFYGYTNSSPNTYIYAFDFKTNSTLTDHVLSVYGDQLDVNENSGVVFIDNRNRPAIQAADLSYPSILNVRELGGHTSDYFAIQVDSGNYVQKIGDTMTGTLTITGAGISASTGTFNHIYVSSITGLSPINILSYLDLHNNHLLNVSTITATGVIRFLPDSYVHFGLDLPSPLDVILPPIIGADIHIASDTKTASTYVNAGTGKTAAYVQYGDKGSLQTTEVVEVSRASTFDYGTGDYINTGLLQRWKLLDGSFNDRDVAKMWTNSSDNTNAILELFGTSLPTNTPVFKIYNSTNSPAISCSTGNIVCPNLNAQYLNGYASTSFALSTGVTSNYVPYTGAIDNLSLGSYSITASTGTYEVLITTSIQIIGGSPSLGKYLKALDAQGHAAWDVVPGGITDHSQLTSTGTLTHDQLEQNLIDIGVSTGAIQQQVNDIAVSTGVLQQEINDVKVSTGILNGYINDLRISTGSIRSDLDQVKIDTGTLRSDLNNVIISTGYLQTQINDVKVSTGLLQQQVYTLGNDTGTLRTDLTNHISYTTSTFYTVGVATQSLRDDLNNVIISTGSLQQDIYNLQASTGSLQIDITNLEISTGSLQQQIYTLGNDTGTLRSDVYNLQQSTGNLVKKTGDTMTGTLTISGAGINSSTGTFGDIYSTYGVNTATIQIRSGTPSLGKFLKATDNFGNATWDVVPGGITDHSQLTSTGTLTHDQLEQNLIDIGVSTGAIQQELNDVKVSTGILNGYINDLRISTGSLQQQIYNIGNDTGTLRTDLNNHIAYATTTLYNVGVATQSLRDDLNSVIVSTGYLQSQVNDINVSTGILNGYINDLRVSTGSIRSDLDQVKIDTGTLRTDLNNVIISTGYLQTQINDIKVSTGALQSEITQIKIDTGTLRADVYSLQQATGTLVKKSGDTMTGTLTITGAGINASTGTFDSVTAGTVTVNNVFKFTVNPGEGYVLKGHADGSAYWSLAGAISDHSQLTSTGTLTHDQLEQNLIDIGVSTGAIQQELNDVKVSTGILNGYINDLRISTGSLQQQLYTLGTDTGTLRSDLNNVIISTGYLQTQINDVKVSTGALQVEITQLKIDTGTLRTDVYNLQQSTGNLVKKSGDTMTGTLTIIGAGVNASTGVFNSVNISTAVIYRVEVSSNIRFADGTVMVSTTGFGGIGNYVLKTGDTMTGKLLVPDVEVTYGVKTATLQVTAGTLTAGYVLTSDGAGNASWQVAPSGLTDHSQLTSTGTLTHDQLEQNLIDIGVSTGAIQQQVNNIAVSTGSLQSEINDLKVSTGSLQQQLYNVGTATQTLRNDLNSVIISTGYLQTQINDVKVSTGVLQQQIYTLGNATGTLRTDLTNHIAYTTSTFYDVGVATQSLRDNLNSVIISTGYLQTQINDIKLSTGSLQQQIYNIGIDTGVLRSDLNNVIVSTGYLQSQITQIGIATGTLRTDVYNLQQSTGNLVQKTGDTMTGTLTISGAGINASTGVFTSINVSTITVSSATITRISVSTITFADGSYMDSAVKEEFFPADTDDVLGSARTYSQIASAAYRYNFRIPFDFKSIVSIDLLVVYISGITNANIDLQTTYGTVGEPYNQHTETDNASTYTATANAIYALNLGTVTTGIGAGDIGGVLVTHNATGSTGHYLGIRVRYK